MSSTGTYSPWSGGSPQTRRYSSMANLKDDLDERQTCPDENEGGLGLAIGAAATATAAAIALLVRTVKEDKSGLVKFYFE